jgi:Phytanoyl-CoA dioxygenase (PhyH)
MAEALTVGGSAPLLDRRHTANVSAEAFARDGFLSLDSLTTPDDIELIRSLLDPLFERFESLGDRAIDYAGRREPGAPPRVPEINQAVILEPRLRQTLAFARCRDMARELLGVPVGYTFDHCIFKAPHSKTPTDWHQDESYNSKPLPLWAAHFWIPLQPATEQNGCMWFIPGSNRGGLQQHHAASQRYNGANKLTKASTLAVANVDRSKAVACPLPVGGATVHHPMTLHYTGANESDGHRKAWILHFSAYGKTRRQLHPKVLAWKFRNSVARVKRFVSR